MPRVLSWWIHFSIIGPYPSFLTLSAILLYHAPYAVAMVTTSHFLSEFSLADLTFAAPVSLLEITSPCPSKDWLVWQSHCDISHNNPCSFTATACRPVTAADFQHPEWVMILLECFVCFTLACHSLQVIVQDITKPNTRHCKETWRIKKYFFFSFLFFSSFTTILSSQQYWEGSTVQSMVF